jgi:hypothetical protein
MMIVGNREREAPATFIISKAVEPVGGADAAVLQSLLDTLAVKPNATVEDVAWQFAETSNAAVIEQMDDLNATVQNNRQLIIYFGEHLQALNAELANLKTDNENLQTDLATVQTAPVPVGTVVSSLIPVAQFQALYGTFSAKAPWVLADGRDVTGSEYAKVMGRNTVPDLRGAFFRGAGNNATQTGWAGGNINTYAEDSTKRPTTAFTTVVNDPLEHNGNTRGIAGAGWGTNESYLFAGKSVRNVSGGGDAETRPKNYVVNYYVKIN